MDGSYWTGHATCFRRMSSIIMKQGSTSSVSLSYKSHGSGATGNLWGLMGDTASWAGDVWYNTDCGRAWACSSSASLTSDCMCSTPDLKIFRRRCMGMIMSRLDRIWKRCIIIRTQSSFSIFSKWFPCTFQFQAILHQFLSLEKFYSLRTISYLNTFEKMVIIMHRSKPINIRSIPQKFKSIL